MGRAIDGRLIDGSEIDGRLIDGSLNDGIAIGLAAAVAARTATSWKRMIGELSVEGL